MLGTPVGWGWTPEDVVDPGRLRAILDMPKLLVPKSDEALKLLTTLAPALVPPLLVVGFEEEKEAREKEVRIACISPSMGSGSSVRSRIGRTESGSSVTSSSSARASSVSASCASSSCALEKA
jgi:hypothetical protein